MLTQLLVLMDGVGSSSGSSVVVAGGSSAAAAGSGDGTVQQGDVRAVKAATEGRVVVIAATNRPGAVDPALRRPGR